MSQRRSKVKQSHVVGCVRFAQFALAYHAGGEMSRGVESWVGGFALTRTQLVCWEDRHIVGGLRLERRFVSAWQTINFAAPA